MSVHPIKPIIPDWEVPARVIAFSTTRSGGVSEGDYHSLNLALHVEDDPQHVQTNRQHLIMDLGLPQQPEWLLQTHSTRVILLDQQAERDGDAAVTSTPAQIAAVLTADCLPVLMCNRRGSEVAAVHAGWRGLLNGILEQTLMSMQSSAEDVLAWLGPAIGAQQFEVGDEVRQAFLHKDPELEPCFAHTRPGHYLADLYAIARFRLKRQGVESVSGGEYCTFSEPELFYSYRRQPRTGRQASLIYINKNPSD